MQSACADSAQTAWEHGEEIQVTYEKVHQKGKHVCGLYQLS